VKKDVFSYYLGQKKKPYKNKSSDPCSAPYYRRVKKSDDEDDEEGGDGIPLEFVSQGKVRTFVIPDEMRKYVTISMSSEDEEESNVDLSFMAMKDPC